ncbi:MAG TPA: cation:proton antiporter [Verrucomicrobiae bacterium]|nr:cation:proton antiporter [Verrucomicrobiae bacterium]
MHGVAFLQDLAIVMTVAAVVTIIFHRLRQPVVLGYILAGVIIGPHTPPVLFLHDQASIQTLAELGMIFLMFALGLEFNFRKLTRVGVTALIAATLEIVGMIWVGYEIGRAFGWKNMDCLFLGAMLSISSTTIIVKALNELGRTKEKFAELIFGILIVEDILAIVLIALLSGIAMTGSLNFGQVVATTTRLGIFLAVTLVLGLLAAPRLIAYVSRFRSNEMLLITVLGLAFGTSLLAAKLGYSVALGAFVIGAIIAEAREIHRIEALTEPLRDMFSAVFFVAIGLQIDPQLIAKYWAPVLVITIAVIVGKVLTCTFGAFVAGNDTRTSLRVGMGVSQIGEFSFIIASLGLTLKVTSEFLYPIAVTVSALTTLTTPYLLRNSDALVGWFDRKAPRRWVDYLGNYTNWVSQLGATASPNMAAQLTRRWFWQIALNLALIAGVFIAVTFVVERRPEWLPHIPGGEVVEGAAWWFCAALLSLPMLVACYRKLEALGMLLGERIGQRREAATAVALQTIFARAIPAIGGVGMGLLILVLSSALLPSWKILLVLLVAIGAVATLLWSRLIRLYSRAQVALKDTLSETPAPYSIAPPSLANLLKEARIETVRIGPGSPAKGKLISELGLRSRTGASIVAIERNGSTVVNPGPDEEIGEGDQILLLGRSEHLQAARRELSPAVP